MSLVEHLDELQSQIIKIRVAFILVAVVDWFSWEQVFDWLMSPADMLGGDPKYS